MDDRRKSSDDLKRRPRTNPYDRASHTSRRSDTPSQRTTSTQRTSNDVYSNKNAAGGFDLNSMSSRRQAAQKKSAKSKKTRVILNVLMSIVLVFSIIGSVGFTMLDSALLENKEQVVEEGKFEEVQTSISGDVSYFLICGTDLSEQLTDIMMVACYDLKNNQMDILQLPRDTYIDDIDFGYGKLNSVYGHPRDGEAPIKALIRRINNDFALPIDHYVTVTIPGFRKIIDALGGVEMTFTREYVVEDSRPTDTGGSAVRIKLAKGASEENPVTVRLKGYEAEGFVRHRNSYAMGDLGRVEAQRQFYAAFAQEIKNINLSELKDIVTNCMSDISTDLTLGQMLGYVEKAHGIDLDKIAIEAVPGTSPSSYYQAKSYWPAVSYFSVNKYELVDLLNEKFRPYETELLTLSDLGITGVPGFENTYNYFEDSNGESFNSINGNEEETTTSSEE